MELISSATCDSFGSGSTLGNPARFDSPSGIATTLAFLSTFQGSFEPVESFISFISLQSSYAWYMKLSQFETVFLALIMIEICFLRYLEVLPININNFFLGDPTGRRRKRSFTGRIKGLDCEGDILTRSLFKVLKKLDDGNCVPLTLCELESMSDGTNKKIKVINRKLPEETFSVLYILKRFAKYRNKQIDQYEKETTAATQQPDSVNDHADSDDNDNSDSTDISNCAVLDGLQSYEDAVLLGSSVAASNYHNSTICTDIYSACPLTKQDIQHYITVLIDSEMLSFL